MEKDGVKEPPSIQDHFYRDPEGIVRCLRCHEAATGFESDLPVEEELLDDVDSAVDSVILACSRCKIPAGTEDEYDEF